jgi:hypothetical protein
MGKPFERNSGDGFTGKPWVTWSLTVVSFGLTGKGERRGVRGRTHVDKEVLDWEGWLCRHLDLDSVFVFEAAQRLAFSAKG